MSSPEGNWPDAGASERHDVAKLKTHAAHGAARWRRRSLATRAGRWQTPSTTRSPDQQSLPRHDGPRRKTLPWRQFTTRQPRHQERANKSAKRREQGRHEQPRVHQPARHGREEQPWQETPTRAGRTLRKHLGEQALCGSGTNGTSPAMASLGKTRTPTTVSPTPAPEPPSPRC